MAYSRDLAVMEWTIIDGHGLSWIVMDCNGLTWTVID